MSSSSSDDVQIVQQVPKWKLFQYQQHSLRIPVSEIASCIGYHPYRDLVQLAMQQVYQGSAGQQLLQHDAKLLGLRLESEEELLAEIVAQAGKSTQDAWKKVVQVQHGVSQVQSVEQAQTLSKAVIEKAKESKKLSRTQIQQLEQASRHGINTGFGTCWEDEALDMYEKQLGCDVRARNEEIKVWPFVRVGDGTTVRPLQDPYCRKQIMALLPSSVQEPEPKRQKNNGAKEDTEQIVPDKESLQISSQKKEECYFSLRGAIDGIRDELVPNDFEEDDDDSWVLQPVIVECKHRMNRLQGSPPLYEMIQVAAYCKMHGVTEADLLQVLRRKKKKPPKEPKEPKDKATEAKEKFRQQTLQFPTSNDENKENDVVESNSKQAAQPVTDATNQKQQELLKPDATVATEQQSKYSEVESELAERNEETRNEKEEECAKAVEADQESRKMPAQGPQESKALNENVPEETPPHGDTGDAGEIKEESTKEGSSQAEKDSPAMDISVIRISMDDPRYQLNQNWESMILPRLKSWVEGIYAIRSSDDKRYRLLMASASPVEVGDDSAIKDQSLQQLTDAWNILFQECPWLIDCDTQYNREIRPYRDR